MCLGGVSGLAAAGEPEPTTVPTGVAERIGSAVQFGGDALFPSALVSHNGILYLSALTAGFTGALFTMDVTTGIATRVGTANQFGIRESNGTGLASLNGTLYMVGSRTYALHTLNPTTGVAARVGSATQF